MSEPRYLFQPGEVRFVWLDEDGERTSPFHKQIQPAYAYRRSLLRHLRGDVVWSTIQRKPFEPVGSGKPPVRLVKVVMAMVEQEMTEDEVLDVAAAERLARQEATA